MMSFARLFPGAPRSPAAAPRSLRPRLRTPPRPRRLLFTFARFSLLTVCTLLCAAGLLFVVFESTQARYDANLFSVGVSALFAGVCLIAALLLMRLRLLQGRLRRLRARLEDVSDENWELKEADARGRRFLDAQGDFIVRHDRHGNITYANAAYRALVGEGRREAARAVVARSACVEDADGARIQDELIATPAGERWIAWHDVTLRSDGADAGETQRVGRDVTARVAAERALGQARDQAREASQAKSRFLAMVSHEVRTPLSGILGMADLLADTALTPEQTTYVKAVKTSGNNLLSLIEDILDFSKIEAGRLDLEARPFSIRALVEEVVELLAPRAQANTLAIASFVDDAVEDWVAGDATRLRQVLLNLAGNALKFTPAGGLAIIVEPGIETGEVTFSVEDTGIGIDPSQHARIFEEFEQAEGGQARRFGGTGLGLAISRRIVARMGGRIALVSAPDAGARFSVSVPLARVIDAPPAAFAAPDLAQAQIMIVAPDTIATALLARRLQDWGARVCVTADGTVAAALLPERPWHALLFDGALARDDAAALLKAAGGVERRLAMVPTGARAQRDALLAGGATGSLLTPLRAASLAARLQAPPAAASLPDDAEDHDRAATTPDAAARGLSVLVVEDNEINALLARALLSKLGHRPTIAQGGEAGTESWMAAMTAGTPYDLVLMDLHMPGIDGLEAARRIRRMEAREKLGRTPIIALSADVLAADTLATDALAASGQTPGSGAVIDAFLVKPMDRERLTCALDALERKAA